MKFRDLKQRALPHLDERKLVRGLLRRAKAAADQIAEIEHKGTRTVQCLQRDAQGSLSDLLEGTPAPMAFSLRDTTVSPVGSTVEQRN